MIKSLLIANRGEIARRIIRTARRLGIRTIAVHSEIDVLMPFVREADHAICIGPAPTSESYLSDANILKAARDSGAAAIHPGYGFLSENAAFAEMVLDAGLVWVGAPPAAIRAMGLKDAAKKLMAQAGVAVTPGYLGEDQSPECLLAEAEAIGFPIMIKAVAGGGGKGMRRVESSSGFNDALTSCRREAAAFADDRVLIEKYILAPRHIEVQIFGDNYGNFVHLFERDCSLQRRHQKVIEEAPAPGMDARTRSAICAMAIDAARAVNYAGAGTVEFIADASEGLRADRIWFMEMNTRLQVEHPVTEAITGEDLVEWQLRVASGEALPRNQDELSISGWAMEARLYAENPANGFLPSTGPLEQLRFPSDIRIDSGVEEGGEVTTFYDPMIAKLIVHEANRTAAAAALSTACAAIEVWPVKTNAAFLARAAADPDFISGDIDTDFISRRGDGLIPEAEPSQKIVEAAAAALISAKRKDPWDALVGFRVNSPRDLRVAVEIAGKTYVGEVVPAGTAAMVGGQRVLFLKGEAWAFSPPHTGEAAGGSILDGSLVAPMPGRIVSVDVKEGERVSRGQKILVLEAMKMEQALVAPFAGIVAALGAIIGQQVLEGDLLVHIENAEVT